ncbi:MAG: hypothetical protein JWN22_871 [Nocardioides sp.]|jgi:hypothetical protein|nr:hypothetical protein [Nocardioides sp.]
MPRLPRALLVLVVVPGLVASGLAAGLSSASAHEERPAQFPDGTGHRPHFLGFDNPRRASAPTGPAASCSRT